MFVSIDLEIITIQLPSQFSQAEISIFAKHRLVSITPGAKQLDKHSKSNCFIRS